jgi:hypothetical protein
MTRGWHARVSAPSRRKHQQPQTMYHQIFVSWICVLSLYVEYAIILCLRVSGTSTLEIVTSTGTQ